MKASHLAALVVGIALGFAVTQILRVTGSSDEIVKDEVAVAPKLSDRRDASLPDEKDAGGSAIREPADAAGYAAYLEKHGYSKEAMVAVALLSRDVEHLIAAAERYPEDPHVQLLVIESDKFPGDKTEWYRRFKQSQPDNMLASLLLGSHLIGEGMIEEALAEMRAACRQSKYDDFVSVGALAMEGAMIELGHSPYDSKVRSNTGSSLQSVLQIFSGGVELSRLVESAGTDEERVELATLGVAIGNQLSEGDANRWIANQLYGLTIEKKFLKLLGPDQALPELAQTPAETIEQIKVARQTLSERIETMTDISERLDEPQRMHAIDRQRILGESDTSAWLIEKFGEQE